MKQTGLALTFILFVSAAINAQTEVSGNVSGVWAVSGSPYLVTGDIHVPTDKSLRIMPGCSIIFQGHYKFCVDSNAVLKAIGNEVDSIIFFPLDTVLTDSSGGHNGVRFFHSTSECRIMYCRIGYGNTFTNTDN